MYNQLKSIDIEKLKCYVKESNSFSHLRRNLNITSKNTSIKNFLLLNNIDFTHFTGQLWYKSYKRIGDLELNFQQYLIADSPFFSIKGIKKYLLKYNLLQNICYICSLLPEYNNLPLTLEIDHINGIRNDHRLENLRILCPNCHSQTETYVSKNKRYKHKCGQCGNSFFKNISRCPCLKSYRSFKVIK